MLTASGLNVLDYLNVSNPSTAVLSKLLRDSAAAATTAVVASIAASVAASVVASAGASAAAGAASGIGAGVAGAIPAMSGAQRFAMYGRLGGAALNPAMRGKPDPMRWTQGKLGFFAAAPPSPPPVEPSTTNTTRRRLASKVQEESQEEEEESLSESIVAEMLDQLVSSAFIMGMVVSVHLLILVWWQFWCNRGFYNWRPGPDDEHEEEETSAAEQDTEGRRAPNPEHIKREECASSTVTPVLETTAEAEGGAGAPPHPHCVQSRKAFTFRVSPAAPEPPALPRHPLEPQTPILPFVSNSEGGDLCVQVMTGTAVAHQTDDTAIPSPPGSPPNGADVIAKADANSHVVANADEFIWGALEAMDGLMACYIAMRNRFNAMGTRFIREPSRDVGVFAAIVMIGLDIFFKEATKANTQLTTVSRDSISFSNVLSLSLFVASHFFLDQTNSTRVGCVLILCQGGIRFIAAIVTPISDQMIELSLVPQSPGVKLVLVVAFALPGVWLGSHRATHSSSALPHATACIFSTMKICHGLLWPCVAVNVKSPRQTGAYTGSALSLVLHDGRLTFPQREHGSRRRPRLHPRRHPRRRHSPSDLQWAVGPGLLGSVWHVVGVFSPLPAAAACGAASPCALGCGRVWFGCSWTRNCGKKSQRKPLHGLQCGMANQSKANQRLPNQRRSTRSVSLVSEACRRPSSGSTLSMQLW